MRIMRINHSHSRISASLSMAASVATLSLLGGVACSRHHHTARTAIPSTPQPGPSRAKASQPANAQKKMTSVPLGYTEEGIASWYGHPYHGRPAADGEIYDMEKLVAAHRLLPFNTWVRVTNLQNGKTSQVRIIDRGPFVDGRIIDLSKAAARQIDLLGPGIGKVRLEVIAAPVDVPSEDVYAVQIGAFSERANAERVRDQYAQQYGAADLAVRQGTPILWRVLVGREHSLAAAQQLAAKLRATEQNVFLVRLDPTTKAGAPIPPPAVPIITAPQAQSTSPDPNE